MQSSRAAYRPRSAVALAGLLWSMGATGCDDTQPAAKGASDVPNTTACEPVKDWDELATHHEDRVVELINDARRLGGRCGDRTYGPQAPLQVDRALRCAARIHAQDMEAQAYVGYKHPEDEDALNTAARLELSGYPRSTFVEAVGAGWLTADEAVERWLTSESHCWKLMTGELDQIGVGLYITPDVELIGEEDTDGINYGHYWDVLVASPR